MPTSTINLTVPPGLQTLLEGVSRAVVEENPDDITEFFALYFQELINFRKGRPNLDLNELIEQFELVKENENAGLEEKASVHTDTLFSGEPEQRDKYTDTEEDHLLEEPDIQYSSKTTQHPSVASCVAESKSLLDAEGASSPEGPQLAYIPAEPAQLAAHVLGNSDSLYSVRNVGTSVQTLPEDSQTSENGFTPVESAAEDVSAVPTAEASVQAFRSEAGVQSQSSAAAQLGTSYSWTNVSNYLSQASSVPLSEEPSPAPKDPLQAVPSCNKTETTSTTEVSPPLAPKDPVQDLPLCNVAEITSTTDVSVHGDDEPVMDTHVLPYVEHFPQKIIIPVVGQTAYLLKIEKPLNAGQGSNDPALVPSAAALVGHSEKTESAAQVESAERVYVLSAMASSEAGQPPPYSNLWTLYCLTDLKQGQKPPLPLPPAGAVATCSQATLSLSRGKELQCGQLSHVSAPVYVMQEESKRENAPPFILVSSHVQNAQDWKPLPGHAVFAQQVAGARRRFTAVPVPVARPAGEETGTGSPSSNPAEESGAKPCPPDVFPVAIPLDDVVSAENSSPAGDKHTG